MKIPLQEKIAELEQRIVKLEAAQQQRPTVTKTTTTSVLTTEQDAHLSKMWSHFNSVFGELGKVFR